MSAKICIFFETSKQFEQIVKNKRKIYQNTYIPLPANFEVSPLLVHQFSIDTPSKLWTMYGVSMEYVWSIFG